MADLSIALNRFGLGARPDDSVPSSPKQWLTAQFDRYQPHPAAYVATLPATGAIVEDLGTYLQQARQLRQERGMARRRDMAPETMSGEMAPGDAPVANMAIPAPAMEGALTPEMMGGKPAPDPNDPVAQARAFARREARDYYANFVGARANIALSSQAPFVERLVHFWANHFAVSADKFQVTGLVGAMEFDAIRPHVLGSFRDMLFAVEQHPAMLLYLDQAQSVGPNSPLGARASRAGRPVGLNENLAREIMELHTLGVRTGYSQADVTEFARAMTGWTVAGLGRGKTANAGAPGSFLFAPQLHEPGTRTIVGKQYGQPGVAQASAVLDDLARHPATARHIATKLTRHFAGDDPPPAMVARLEAAFTRSGGDLPTVYRAIIDSPEAWVAQPVKFKSPWEWAVSSMRALGTNNVQAPMVFGLMNQLGQPIWKPGSPAGYDDVAGSWAGPDAVLRRVEAAQAMAQRAAGTIDARARAAQIFPGALSAGTAEQLARAESPGQALALMLVSPEFMRR